MQDQQVDLVDAELARTLLEAVQRLLIPVVADPDLGLKEGLRALEARTPELLSDLPLVAVRRCRVDVPVAGCQRRLDCRPSLLRRRLEDTKSERGQHDTVVQSYEIHTPTVRTACRVPGGTAITPLTGADQTTTHFRGRHARLEIRRSGRLFCPE